MRTRRYSGLTFATVIALLSLLMFAGTAAAHEAELASVMSGDEEVAEGDADGRGAASIAVNDEDGEVCWDLDAQDIELPAAAAHIHRGAAGVDGDIVVTLSPPDAEGRATGCDSEVDSALINEIMEGPAGFYVNVHTTDYPAGAIRGQLAGLPPTDTAPGQSPVGPLALLALGVAGLIGLRFGTTAFARRER